MGHIESRRNNRKLWTFVFGCIIANTYVWLANIAHIAPVPEILHLHPLFILDYYPKLVTIGSAILFALFTVFVMSKTVKICVSEHILWLVLPTLSFIGFTAITSHVLFLPILSAALPTLLVLSLVYLFKKRQRRIGYNRRISFGEI